jgi:DNA-binding transcriptional LysR family regulator
MKEPSAALRAFRLVAEHASFTRAAEELNVTPSALSQTLVQLEENLQVRLLQRSTRHVGLTEAGRWLLERITGPLREIDAALEQTREQSGRPTGRLTVTSSRVAASAFIEPILPDFLRRYPEIVLDLRIERDLVDIIAAGIDAGIRLGEKIDRDMIRVSLAGVVRSVVVGAPSYLERHGRPAHPRDLATHNCIRVTSAVERQPLPWDFCEHGRQFEVAVTGSLITNDSALASRAALTGVGLRSALLVDVQEDIAAGRLESILEAWLPSYEGFFLYYSSRAQMPAKLRVFIDCVLEHARKSRPDRRASARPTGKSRRTPILARASSKDAGSGGSKH